MVKRQPFLLIEETIKDAEAVAVVVEDEDVVSGDSTVKKEMFEETKIEASSQVELEEISIIEMVRTGGNKRIVKVTKVSIATKEDIMQKIVGPRELKEMLQQHLRARLQEKKIRISRLPSLSRRQMLLIHEGKAQ